MGASEGGRTRDKELGNKVKRTFSRDSAVSERSPQGGKKKTFGENSPKRPFGKGKPVGKGKPAGYAKPAGRPVDKAVAAKHAGAKVAGGGLRKMHQADRGATSRHAAPQVAQGAVLLWGLHAVAAAWLNPSRVCTQLFLTEAGEKTMQKAMAEGKARGLPRPAALRVDRLDLDRLTPSGSVHQGIVCAVKPLPEMDLHDVIGAEAVPNVVVVLDQVTDPHNVGAILRSAAAFGAGAVVLTERNAPSATGVLAKSASGALEVVPMVHVVNLSRALDDLREAGYWCVGLAEEGERSLSQLDLTARTAIVLGAEGEGLRHLTRQKCDEIAHLPTSSELGSLNVSNAAAVALYEVKRQKL